MEALICKEYVISRQSQPRQVRAVSTRVNHHNPASSVPGLPDVLSEIAQRLLELRLPIHLRSRKPPGLLDIASGSFSDGAKSGVINVPRLSGPSRFQKRPQHKRVLRRFARTLAQGTR
jgi:hypothetical protein